MKKQFRKKEIILLAISILFAFIICDIASMTWLGYFATRDQRYKYSLYTEFSRKEWQFSPHHYLSYYPTPNYKKGLLSHNYLGFRGDYFSVKKPKGVYRIVLIGESSTYDSAINDNNKTFAVRLCNILKNKYEYKNIEVINAGVSAYSSWESLINLEFRVLDIDPDLIIVYHAVNDVHARLVIPSYYRGDNSGKAQTWSCTPIKFWQKICLLRIIARKLGMDRQIHLDEMTRAPTAIYMYNASRNDSDKIIEVLKRNPPIYFERNLRNMIAIAKEHNIEIILATWAHSPYFNDYASTKHYEYGLRENNDVVKKVAISHKVLLFDFENVMPKDKEYWKDGRHSNEIGAQKKAELFAEFIHQKGLIKTPEIN